MFPAQTWDQPFAQAVGFEDGGRGQGTQAAARKLEKARKRSVPWSFQKEPALLEPPFW